MFSSGAGLEVRGHGGKMLSLTALLPETFLNQTEGLFGLMNGQRQDDLTLPNGTALDVASSGPREHFAFGADCECGRSGGEMGGRGGSKAERMMGRAGLWPPESPKTARSSWRIGSAKGPATRELNME